jgi:hypothetical protein
LRPPAANGIVCKKKSAWSEFASMRFNLWREILHAWPINLSNGPFSVDRTW